MDRIALVDEIFNKDGTLKPSNNYIAEKTIYDRKSLKYKLQCLAYRKALMYGVIESHMDNKQTNVK